MSSISRHLLPDAALLAAAGLAFGLAANALSPRGLSLRRDYFPPAPAAVGDAARANAAPAGDVAAPSSSPLAPPAASAPTTATPKLSARGFVLATHEEVARWHADRGLAEGRILFIDARNEAHYQRGHIQGARLFDHYRMDQYIADIAPLAQMAERIIVYCTGGDCEDSELVASDLVAIGVPSAKIVIYAGGITEWKKRGAPIAKGAPRSGAAQP